MITQHFTAAVLEQVGQPLKLVSNIEVPTLEKGQVLCRIKYAGLCHSQLMEVQGKRGEDKFLPHLLGHEGVAEVVDVGPEVSKVQVGDNVVMGWIKGHGQEGGPVQYQCDGKTINSGSVTTFSTFSVVSENRLVKVPTGFDDKVAVLFGCALPTGAGIVLNQLQPKADSTVVIVGLGGIGLSALLAMQHFTPRNIVAIDIEPHKLDLAKQLGATDTFVADEQGLREFSEQFPNGVDYAVESAGRASTIELAFKLIRRNGGHCIFASHPPAGEMINIDPFEMICGKRLEGSWGGACLPDKDIPVIADIIRKYHIPVELLLSKEYSLAQINDALADLQQRKIARALISME